MASPELAENEGQASQAIVPKELSEVEKLKKDLEEERSRSQEYLTRLKYLQADFENYRKRNEKETMELVDLTKEVIVRKLLEVVDSLELAVTVGKKSREKKGLLSGVEMTLKMLLRILSEEGLSAIEAVGKPYDPSKHEVVERVTTEAGVEGTVVEEIRKGFTFKGRVIRPSMVVVSSSHLKNQVQEGGNKI
jgi:molecular chaperone GrpE